VHVSLLLLLSKFFFSMPFGLPVQHHVRMTVFLSLSCFSHLRSVNPLIFPQASMPPIPGGPQQMHPGGQPHVPGNVAPGIQGMSQPGSPAGNQPGSATSRIDPNQIPRPQSTAMSVTYVTRVENQSNVPPVQSAHFLLPCRSL
jgi:hypothetical protein